jgi:hypothetical protein
MIVELPLFVLFLVLSFHDFGVTSSNFFRDKKTGKKWNLFEKGRGKASKLFVVCLERR